MLFYLKLILAHIAIHDDKIRLVHTRLTIMNAELNPRTYFIKASHETNEMPTLNAMLVARNSIQKIETTLLLDTNILIAMEKALAKNAKASQLKEYGLENLVSILQKCPPKSICLSPGLALHEMPPNLADQARISYEMFVAKFLPSFIDTPNAINIKYEDKVVNYGFFDLEEVAQQILAIPFISLLYLGIVDKFYVGKPIEKFNEYIRLVIAKLDVLSTRELEIAKYCFANPSASAENTISMRKKIRSNFLKTKSNKLPIDAAEAIAIAFNGACDINLLNTANKQDKKNLDGNLQDIWVATRDKKLYEFCCIFHHINIDGNVGKYSASISLLDQKDDEYWKEAQQIQSEILQERKIHAILPRSDESLIVKAQIAVEAIKREFVNPN